MASGSNQTSSKYENYIDGLQNEAKVRYKAKLQLIGVSKCPYEVSEEMWLEDPSEWPSLTYPDLYHYLIKTQSKFFPFLMKKHFILLIILCIMFFFSIYFFLTTTV